MTTISLREREPLVNAAFALSTIKRMVGAEVRVVQVPGHDTINTVFLWTKRRNGHIVKLFECNRDSGIGRVPCPAYAHGKVCYHAMAAVKAAAEENGYRVVPGSWRASEAEAQKLRNLAQYHRCQVGELKPQGWKEQVWFLYKELSNG